MAALIGLLVPGFEALSADEIRPIEDITGVWVTKEDPSAATVTVTASGDGLMHIEGRDKESKFQSACLSFGYFGKCVGHGLTLENSAGFLSQSIIRLTKDGEILETWLVRSADEELTGQTLWRRK